MRFEASEHVESELPVMRTGLQNLALPVGHRHQPSSKPIGQQFPEQRAHADAGKVVAIPPWRRLGTFIVSKIWTIQGQLHEPGEGYRATKFHLVLNDTDNTTVVVHIWAGPTGYGHES